MNSAAVNNKERVWQNILRLCIFFAFIAMFLPGINPARLSGLMNSNNSLFTNIISYDSISSVFGRAIVRGWVEKSTLRVIQAGAIICGLGIALLGASFCMSLGNNKLRRLGIIVIPFAALAGFAGATVLRIAHGMLENSPDPGRLNVMMPTGNLVFYIIFAVILVIAGFTWFYMPKPIEGEVYELDPRYRLFLMILPFLVLIFLFAYLPLWGWRIAFFDYQPGIDLSMDNFVGLKWINNLFQNAATRIRILEVVRNTLAMSGIGLATSWLPMVFAIFLTEMRSKSFKSGVQTLTTVPNFISWVMVYTVAFAIFSNDGFFNWLLISLGIIQEEVLWLNSGDYIWLKMWAWGTWKGLGWGAIIYLAAISGIDPQLYEAAEVDGAGRFKRMWHITVPGLLNTYFVLLLLAISNVLNSGLEQYLMFFNPITEKTIEVLDLYVYHLGIGGSMSMSNSIPMATLVGMFKSIISIILLFSANRVSKWLRGDGIV